ncbi:GNAT family N-acetyltransferase [Oceanibacterium hippocampi]|uniref:Acetyltransferase (GNAT) family protein n=1 Tax=Oceanibacterium hippocampi TaxID=745714 RepID=A0A1Y5SZ63_9PROT|nr:GNAT family N-acetyltransferase [Oceanibacterium hippocampi]SLN49952.1 Acetyltransferase (GNAT) family protein [Oceanibacterium hippocampi]
MTGADRATPPRAVDGKWPVTVTYLEMRERPQRPTVPRPAVRIALMRAEKPTVSFYRYLYDAVGRSWYWYERKRLSDAALRAIIQDEKVEVVVLYVAGVPAGYAELDCRKDGVVDLAYFGLVPEFIGHGLGGYFLNWAIDEAWQRGPERVTVNTCTLDHPRALPLYQRLGFVPYRRADLMIDPPR